ncbi:MAG: hypothetical protein CL609_23475 [Anaerolineaceae bacterium]|nr:hypothetical protein [Anaerolineaceae bacterium]
MMKRIPNAIKWLKSLSNRYGKEKAKEILKQSITIYQELLVFSHSTHKKTHSRQYHTILSVLAVYRTLLEKNKYTQTALSETEVLFKDVYFQTQLKGIHLLNRIPNPFPIIRPVLKTITKFSDKKSGQEIIQDNKNCFAVNVYQCGIFDTLKQFDAAELTPIFCASDDWLSDAMPKIDWQRTQTLGRGGEMCDFKWCVRKL